MRQREKTDGLLEKSRKEHDAHHERVMAAATAGLIDMLKYIVADRPTMLVRELNKPMLEKVAFATIQAFICENSKAGDPGDIFKSPDSTPAFLD